jgi:hypothetical protein
MKRLAGILLVSVFMLYLGGIQLMYWLKMDGAKQKASLSIQNHNLKKADIKDFVLTSSQYNSLNWLEKNKEFTLNNQLYDIAGIEYSSNGIKITCYTDNEETELADAFGKFADRFFSTNQQSNGSENDLINKITKEYLPLPSIFSFAVFEKEITSIIKNDIHCSVSLPDNIWHPPATC